MFNLIWEGEIIDTVDTRDEAAYLAQEYKLAYGGGQITIEEADEDDGQPTWEQEWEDFGECGYEMEYI